MNKYSTEHFTLGFENTDRKRGQIYLNNIHFANFFTNPPDWGDIANKISLNRDWLASRVKYQGENIFVNPEYMIKYLENWYCNQTKTNLEIFEIGPYKMNIHHRIDGLYYASIELDGHILEFTKEALTIGEVVLEGRAIIEKFEIIQHK